MSIRSLTLCFLLTYAIGYGQINFVDKASELGIGISSGDTPFGSGVIFYDYNKDGWDDITIATEANEPIRFFRNDNGVFTEEFLNIPANTSQVKQINWVDYNDDGTLDLYVTSNISGNRLYQNDGNFNFTDVTNSSMLPTDNLFTNGSSWGDYNNDGFLDLFLSNRDVAEIIPNYLYRNNGDGTFTNVSETAGILNTSNLSFCSAFVDYDNDGWQDIYVANDRVIHKNVMYRNNGDGTFTEVSQITNTDLYIDAMSVTVDDYNNDGYWDIYVTNTTSGNVFLRNNGDGTYTNVAPANGTTFDSIGWGAVFLDVENDSDLDLYVSGSLSGTNPNFLSAALYENDGTGNYTEVNSGFLNDNVESYSNAIGDVNNDGIPEILVNNSNNSNIFLWKNEANPTNNWLKINLSGVQSNSQGIGSKIEISINNQKQYRYVLCGEGYLSQNSGTEFFGVGTNTIIDYVRVYWLSGIVDEIQNINVNQSLNIVEGSFILSDADLDLAEEIKIIHDFEIGTCTVNSGTSIRSYDLMDVTGKTILSEYDLNQNSFVIDYSQLTSGIYVLNITSEIGKEVRKILVD